LQARGREVTIRPMGESVDESRSGDEGQAEAKDENSIAEPAAVEKHDNEPQTPRDDYVPV
jgi:hypothetical protein